MGLKTRNLWHYNATMKEGEYNAYTRAEEVSAHFNIITRRIERAVKTGDVYGDFTISINRYDMTFTGKTWGYLVPHRNITSVRYSLVTAALWGNPILAKKLHIWLEANYVCLGLYRTVNHDYKEYVYSLHRHTL